MVSKRYQIRLEVDLAVDELAECPTAGATRSADDQSRSCVTAVQRRLLDDPRACDIWLRQCLLWYVQDGVLQEQLRNIPIVSDAASPLGLILARLAPSERHSIAEWAENGTIFEELEELYDSVSVRRAVLAITPVTGIKPHNASAPAVARGAAAGRHKRAVAALANEEVPR